MASTAVDSALRLAAAGAVEKAVRVLSSASDGGDTEASMQLALWHLSSAELPRNLPEARRWLRTAAQGGHPDAALMEIALTANGTGTAPDWAGALRLLRDAAVKDTVAAEHLALVDAMKLDERGRPCDVPVGQRLSESPDVTLFRALLTAQECQHIAQVAHGSLAPAVVIDPATGKMITHPIRTSLGTVIGPTWETLAIGAINRRLAAVSETDVQQGEPLAVLHYAPGQQYHPHFDTITGSANQRVTTALVYLNQGYTGGETKFTANGLTIAGQMGDVVVFKNVLSDGSSDPRSQHAGLPVTRGVKWLATRWIRAKPYDPWYPT